MIKLLTTPIGRLRVIAFFEGVSFLIILFITMPLKYLFETPGPNQIIGMTHGVLFFIYSLSVFEVHTKIKWGFKKSFLTMIASLIPFGTFWADHTLFKDPK